MPWLSLALPGPYLNPFSGVHRSEMCSQVDEQTFQENEALYEKLLEVDDVDSVWTTCEGLDS